MNVRTACSRGRRARALVGIAALLAALSGCDRDHPVPREQVFVAGGYDLQGHYSADVQFYDVQTRTFVSGGTMRNKRIEYGAVLLPSGLILIAGGSVSHEVNDAGLDAAELYSPSTETARPTKRPLNVPRAAFTATLLKSGKVLLTGGSDDSGIPLASVEIYDPQTDTFAPSQCTMSSLEHEKPYPDDLETLRKAMPSVEGIYPSTRWADRAMTRALVQPPSTCQIVRRDGRRRVGWYSTNSLT